MLLGKGLVVCELCYQAPEDVLRDLPRDLPPPVLVLGRDGKIHEAEAHIHEDLSACDRIVAVRRVSLREAELLADRMCPRCFAEAES
jgi:hypothetical protein